MGTRKKWVTFCGGKAFQLRQFGHENGPSTLKRLQTSSKPKNKVSTISEILHEGRLMKEQSTSTKLYHPMHFWKQTKLNGLNCTPALMAAYQFLQRSSCLIFSMKHLHGVSQRMPRIEATLICKEEQYQAFPLIHGVAGKSSTKFLL